MDAVKVIFRTWEDQVIALFPEDPAESDNWYNCTSYMHIGQHSACDPHMIIQNSKLATETEYSALKEELESIGYELIVCSRMTQSMHDTRKETWKAQQ